MAAYRRVYDSRHLQTDCQDRGQLRNHTLGNRVRASCAISLGESGLLVNESVRYCAGQLTESRVVLVLCGNHDNERASTRMSRCASLMS